jgi:hypothetical protein
MFCEITRISGESVEIMSHTEFGGGDVAHPPKKRELIVIVDETVPKHSVHLR